MIAGWWEPVREDDEIKKNLSCNFLVLVSDKNKFHLTVFRDQNMSNQAENTASASSSTTKVNFNFVFVR